MGILDGYVWILNRDEISFHHLFNEPDYGASRVIRAFDDMGLDNVCTNSHTVNIIFRIMGGQVSYDKIGHSFEVIIPPLEEISDIYNFDVDEVMKRAMADSEFMSTMHMCKLLKKHYGDSKAIMSNCWSPFTFATMMVGVENFMVQMNDDEEATQALIDFTTEILCRFYNLFLEYGSDTIMICDPVASCDMVSPATFEKWIMPSIKKTTAYLKEKKAPTLIHICGNSVARNEPLCNCGISGLSMDSTPLTEGLAITRGHYALMGGMNPYHIMELLPKQEVYNHCYNLCQEAGLSGGFILMPGCDLSPGIPLENLQAMVQAAHNVIL